MKTAHETSLTNDLFREELTQWINDRRQQFHFGCSGVPYDGHTLKSALDQMESIIGFRPKHSFVDNGYKGHEETLSQVPIARKKRNAIEALFSHAKRDGQLGRNYLKGIMHGDQLNALLSAVGHHLRLILLASALFCAHFFWRGCVLRILYVIKRAMNFFQNQCFFIENTVFQG